MLNLQSERRLQLLEQLVGLNRMAPGALEPGDQRRLSLDAPKPLRHVPVGKLKAPEGGRPVCSKVHNNRETPDRRSGSWHRRCLGLRARERSESLRLSVFAWETLPVPLLALQGFAQRLDMTTALS